MAKIHLLETNLQYLVLIFFSFFSLFKTLHCTLFSGSFIFFKKTHLNNKLVSYILKLHTQC